MSELLQGDCLIRLKELKDNSIDAIITDPPYELGFMGKKWDNSGIAYNVEMWKECLRLHLHKHFNFAESQEETVWPSLRHSCRSELTRQGISLP